jgi:hypothetical protein
LVGFPVLRPKQIIGHDERNLRVGIDPIKKKAQVMLVNKEAK